MTTGIGNGSTFQMIPRIFVPELARPVLGWTSAIAAYGSFLIPMLFSITITLQAPEATMYGLAAFFAVAAALNWWYYARKGAEKPDSPAEQKTSSTPSAISGLGLPSGA